jgi:hypothetical protein
MVSSILDSTLVSSTSAFSERHFPCLNGMRKEAPDHGYFSSGRGSP